MYPRLPDAAAQELLTQLRPGAGAPPGGYPIDQRPDLPAVLVYARYDEFFEPDWERFLASDLGIDAIELPTGHFPMTESPQALAELLDELAL
jgi:pimeloyl-ACP methyl ester carboxylesterase